MASLTDLTLTTAVEGLKRKEFSSGELTEADLGPLFDHANIPDVERSAILSEDDRVGDILRAVD